MKLTLGTAAVLALLTAAASANVRLRPPGSIYVGIDLEVGGAPFAAKGAGECSYASDTSIDRMPGQMWSVRQHDSAKDVSFTLWQLKQGGEMFTLNVTSGGTMHRVNTTHAGPASDHAGSGWASVAKQGKSGQFSIDAVDDTGVRVTGTLFCSGFMAAAGSAPLSTLPLGMA